MRILICGATGYVGSRLMKNLLEHGHFVRCLARNPEYIDQRIPTKNLETIRGDLLDSNSLSTIFDDIDIVYYLVHSLAAPDNFMNKEYECAQNIIRGIGSSNVKRIIYLGGLGTSTKMLSSHLKSRKKVGEILRSSNVKCVELQASVIIGSGSFSYEIMRSLVERLPIMLTPKWVSSLSQPIWIGDVITYLYQSMEIDINTSVVIEIGGPDQVTYKELMALYAKIINKKRIMISVPFLTPNLSSKWLGLVTPVYARVGKKLIESLKSDSIIKNPSSMRIFNIFPLGVEKSLIETLKSHKNLKDMESRWYDSVSSGVVNYKANDIQIYKYQYIDSREIIIPTDPISAFLPINRIGGETGWYFANKLWLIRGWIDIAVGGVGLRRRKRKHTNKFLIGDTLDWWRITKVIDNKLVRFEAEMKMPGKAWLEFELVGNKTGTLLKQTAGFRTNSILGQIYWFGLLPLHKIIFKGMLKNIAKQALKI
jgi:uncharacterized protein YbjT (DUF2867 family)